MVDNRKRDDATKVSISCCSVRVVEYPSGNLISRLSGVRVLDDGRIQSMTQGGWGFLVNQEATRYLSIEPTDAVFNSSFPDQVYFKANQPSHGKAVLISHIPDGIDHTGWVLNPEWGGPISNQPKYIRGDNGNT